MGKPRDLANVVATGNILADGAVAPAELTGVTSTAAEINILDGVTATAAELNLMDGVTATTAELNYVDGVTSAIQTQIDTKAPVAGPTFTGTLAAPTINASTALQIGGAAITATATELNKMDGVTVSASDINSVTAKAPIDGATFTGTTTIPTADINGGAIDGAIIGANSAAAVTATTLNASTKLQVNGTDVITNARALSNITSIDSTTAAAIGAGGVGGGGEIELTASGSLSNGDLVKLNSDGTVSVVAGGGAGSEATFANTNCSNTAATFDSNLNKVVVVTKDGGNSNYGNAVVGTISGSSISFGTPVVFETAHANGMAITFDSNSNKVVIVYRDVGNNNYGTAIVGTVSGTSISFGSHVVWETNLAVDLAATFDSNSNKVVIAYRDYGNSNHGTAIIGTVSGTSISFGSKVVFNAAASEDISATFDSNSNKVVIAYRDDGNSTYGTAIVGTVSGTSISFGSEAVFNSRQSNHSSCTFDSNSNKVVIAYKNVDDGQRGEAVVGTVSGTSISFGAPVEFQGAGGKVGDYVSIVFDSGSNQVVILYTDLSNSPSVLSVVVASINGTSLNLKPSTVLDSAGYEQLAMTFDSNSNSAVALWSKQDGNIGTAATYKPSDVFNWIGFASADVSNGATATINVVSSVNEGQSSLTVGAKYYLPDSGTLSTASVSGREVGFATAATKLLITQGSVS